MIRDYYEPIVVQAAIISYLQSQLQPLSGGDPRELRSHAPVDPLLVLRDEPRRLLHRPDHGEAVQRLGKVRVDRREGDGSHPLQIPGRGAVVFLANGVL